MAGEENKNPAGEASATDMDLCILTSLDENAPLYGLRRLCKAGIVVSITIATVVTKRRSVS
jgi:hypothetical protein